jgi:hypothetical protein
MTLQAVVEPALVVLVAVRMVCRSRRHHQQQQQQQEEQQRRHQP